MNGAIRARRVKNCMNICISEIHAIFTRRALIAPFINSYTLIVIPRKAKIPRIGIGIG